MTPGEAYIAGLLTLPVLLLLIAAARPTRSAPTGPPASPPAKNTHTLTVELDGIDRIESDLARVTRAATEASARLREVAELGERIARKDT